MRDKNQSPIITFATPTLLDKQDLNNQLEALLTSYAIQNPHQDPDLTMLLPDIKKAIAEACLEHTRGNQSEAARLLGIHRFTLKGLYTGIKKRTS
ncbi:helix-turn-helix domain-containing protein [Vibrio jasicida]|uniref:helix-turn-helix domain-containing protein n=1 Tax=Vibrio jasicida TaxID=766224 RepID=UPI0009E5876F|nr:helix-turn-helix domain-containing protein [Vibrio jasicida]